MNTVKSLPEFDAWLARLADDAVRGAILARIRRLQHGLLGDASSIGGGVFELRIHLGAGWRIYFTQQGSQIIFLLAGGTKGTQSRDIKRAKALAKLLQ
jgi:putative addiction module killer protein